MPDFFSVLLIDLASLPRVPQVGVLLALISQMSLPRSALFLIHTNGDVQVRACARDSRAHVTAAVGDVVGKMVQQPGGACGSSQPHLVVLPGLGGAPVSFSGSP